MTTASVFYLAGTILAFLVFAVTLAWVSRRN